MRPLDVIVDQPDIHVVLQVLHRCVERLPQHDAEKLLTNGPLEPFDKAVRRRVLHLGPTMLDVVERQIELIWVALAVILLGSIVGQNRTQRDVACLIEGDDIVVDKGEILRAARLKYQQNRVLNSDYEAHLYWTRDI